MASVLCVCSGAAQANGNVGPSLEYGVAVGAGVNAEDFSADEANISLIRLGFAIFFAVLYVDVLVFWRYT